MTERPFRLPKDQWIQPVELNSFELEFLLRCISSGLLKGPRVADLSRKLAIAKSLLNRMMSDD